MAGETAGRMGGLWLAATSSGTLVEVARVRNWSVDGSEDLIDITNNDSSGERQFIRGTKSHTASVEALYLSTAATDNQEEVLKMFSSSGSRWFSLRPTTATVPAWLGTGYARSFSVGGQSEDADILNLEIQFTGAVTYST